MDKPLRVLIVEDADRDVAQEVRALKAAGYQVTYTVVVTATEMKAALADQVFDIVLADHDLPQFDAPGALAVLKQSGQDIPFIIVSGVIGEEIAVALMKAGANDYVMKDKLARFVPAVQRELSEAESRRERKWADEKLRASEERFRTAAENLTDVIYDWDIKDTMDWYGDIDGVLGYPPGGFSRTLKAWAAMIHPEDRDRVMAALEDHVKGVAPFVTEYRVAKRDGENRWWSARGTALRDDRGEPYKMIGSITDITDRKRAEEEKFALEKQLARSQKLESIGTLAGGIAHDFNNLLMGIQGNASLMMIDLDASHPHYERLRHIEESVSSGADLTRQLLGFARGGRYDVKPFSMNEVVEKSALMFGRTKKEIAIHRKYAQDPCVVEVDRSQMEQVFMNLFVNAWQAMPDGGDIFIETEVVVVDEPRVAVGTIEPGRYVKVNVTDTGIGMDEQTMDRIFDPFFTTKTMGRGTGLGLASVHGTIKGHGGMINVYSEPGQGTTFTLYLPASKEEPAEEKATTGDVLKGTETILLVDDEQMVLDVSRDMLESLGYRVYPAGSGQEALAVYTEKKDEIDLVVLDMIMPGISGSETFDQLQEINPEVKVLLASGYSLNDQAQDIIDRGCDGFIQKPSRLEKLSQMVRKVLDG